MSDVLRAAPVLSKMLRQRCGALICAGTPASVPVCAVSGRLRPVVFCGEATQSPARCRDVRFRFELPAGANRSFLSSVPSPLRNEMVLLSAEPQFLQQDWLMEGCDFPAAIPP